MPESKLRWNRWRNTYRYVDRCYMHLVVENGNWWFQLRLPSVQMNLGFSTIYDFNKRSIRVYIISIFVFKISLIELIGWIPSFIFIERTYLEFMLRFSTVRMWFTLIRLCQLETVWNLQALQTLWKHVL